MFKKTLIISILIHLCLFFKIQPKMTPPKKKSKISKITRVKFRFIKSIPNGGKKCEHFYIGLGISYSLLTGEISDVAKGSPADFNDMRIGDVLGTVEDFMGLEVGTQVDVVLIRNGITIVKKIKIEKICTNGE